MKADDWQAVDRRIKVVSLSGYLRFLVPALFISALPIGTRGISYEGGRLGFTVGAILVVGSLAIGDVLLRVTGPIGGVVIFWLLGSSGVVMMINGVRPIAFVKPICIKCRLLPVIKEHEAIHMAGVESDDRVWESMRMRYSCESLSLDGDPNICSFCPIPRRLREK
jgi:hypothetical protein